MSDQQTYNLVYAGAIQTGFDQEQVKASFINQLKIPEDKVDQLFSGKLLTLKKSLNREKAKVWQEKLLAIGAETGVVPCVDPQIASASFSRSDQNQSLEQLSMPVKKKNSLEPTVVANPEAQSEYEEDMHARILKAKAIIATQQMAMQLDKKKESNPMKRLFLFSGVLCVLIFMLYYYVGSML